METIDPIADTEYREITVRLWGKGVVERGRVLGAGVSGCRFVARTGQFIASRIDARNGALGLVPETLDGALVTNDFPLFRVLGERLAPGYLQWLCRTESFVDLCLRASEGTTNRVRLKEDAFLGLEISLPPLPEQQRIVSRIESFAGLLQSAIELNAASAESSSAFVSGVQRAKLTGAPSGRVADFLRFQTGYAFKSEWFAEHGIRLARNANVGHGHLDWSDSVYLPSERQSEFSSFELFESDVLLALDRPLISTGVRVARVSSADLPALLLQRVARARFVDDRLTPTYFFRWLQSPIFARAIDPGRSNGVPHISHKDVERLPIHVPTPKEQARVVAELDAFDAEVIRLQRAQNQTRRELAALLPAILDRAFSGAL